MTYIKEFEDNNIPKRFDCVIFEVTHSGSLFTNIGDLYLIEITSKWYSLDADNTYSYIYFLPDGNRSSIYCCHSENRFSLISGTVLKELFRSKNRSDIFERFEIIKNTKKYNL